MTQPPRATTAQRLDALARPDKWYLSAGDGVLWAPPFPAWLHVPGFWDEAHVYYHAVAPLFAVALVDAAGRAVPLERVSWRWRPDRIDAQWRLPSGDVLDEQRIAAPGGRFVSSWRVAGHVAASPSWLVAFSMQPGDTTRDVASIGDVSVSWMRRVADRRNAEVDVAVTLTALGVADVTRVRRAAVRSEGSAAQPIWLHTPFAERWTSSGLPDDIRLEGISTSGFVHVALAVPLTAGDLGFAIDLAGRWDESSVVPDVSAPVPVRLPAAMPADLVRSASGGAEAFFDAFPRFSCSDPFLTRYYDYRLYGLRLNRLAGGAGHVRHPCIAEGIGYFHVPITYSAQCHMWEMRWSRDPAVAFGSLRNFLATQKDDGAFHGRIYSTHLERTDFYHANWGDAVQAALDVHDDEVFAREAFEGLSRHAEWLVTSRDRDGTGLFDVIDQYETGQEYMSRYLAVDPDADRYGWENRIRLKGIDISVYGHQLFALLERLAARVGDASARARWAAALARTASAITSHCWDDEAGIFTDVAPGTLARTGVKAAVGFYPLLTGLVTDAQAARLFSHLSDSRTFGTPFPLPSSSVDDPLFNPLAEWKGKRHVCPWNGRAWPMTTSHVVEGLLRQWQGGRREAGAIAGDVLTRYVRMFFDRGDLARPTCYEHYNPLTGDAAFYRGIDDYMHSWVADLLIRGVAGLEPTSTGVLVDPLPLPLDWVSLEGATIRGHVVDVERQGDTVRVAIDGRSQSTRVGVPLEVRW